MKRGNPSVYLLALSALGIVYGDIGTSPLYAFKESLHPGHGIDVNVANIFGILSLIFWSLIIIISIKYLVFIVRADNRGEGGVLALTSLIGNLLQKSQTSKRVLTLMGLFGTALLYGDGIITPAISVLSAVEGLELAAPSLHPYIIPITVVILIGIFSIQKHGTASVGKVFGPVTLLWFVSMGVLGLNQILKTPVILNAMNPVYAWNFFALTGWNGFLVLGSVFLVVTGGEALYSDLGHFGKNPIRLAWFFVALPALALNYFGQGALLLSDPSVVKNPFYYLAPSWALLPLIILATASTIIASQALITGVFSLTMQAVQLQYIPRVHIAHTSKETIGQIYVPSVNMILMFACIGLVLSFKTSSNLAAAYGIAVTTTMVITTVLFYFVARHSWGWRRWTAMPLCGFFLLIEGSFWGANLLKVPHGGWFPLVVGFVIFTLMTTWHSGRKLLYTRMLDIMMPLKEFLQIVEKEVPQRVPGMAVYMVGRSDFSPPTLTQSYKHYNCLHETVVFIYVETVDTPHVPPKERVKVMRIGDEIYDTVISYGFMDLPHIPEAMNGVRIGENVFNSQTATFFLGREHLMATEKKGMMIWREKLFALMSRNAQPATRFFHLPSDRVVEIGSVIEL